MEDEERLLSGAPAPAQDDTRLLMAARAGLLAGMPPAAPACASRAAWLACAVLAAASVGTVIAARDMVQRAVLSPALATQVTLVTMMANGYRQSIRRELDGWPSSAGEQALLFEQNWRCFAALHNLTLYIERTDSGSFPRTDVGLRGAALHHWKAQPGAPAEERLRRPPPYHPFWMKVELLRRYLPHAQWVVWFDADALFLSLPTSPAQLLARVASPSTDLVVLGSRAAGSPADELASAQCACIFAVRNTAGGAWFVERWHALRGRTVLWGDQGAFNQAAIEMALRFAATLAAGPGAPPWHTRAWDGVTSPCLPPHWAWAENDTRTQADCLARTARELRATHGMPGFDERSGWPVAWSTELAGNYNGFRLAGESNAWMFSRAASRARWPAVRAQLERSVLRAGARGELDGDAPMPRLLAHTKSGPMFPLATIYRQSTLPRLVRTCAQAIACANATAFVRNALFAQPPGAAHVTSGAAVCNGRRGDTALSSVRARLAHLWRAVHIAHAWKSAGMTDAVLASPIDVAIEPPRARTT